MSYLRLRPWLRRGFFVAAAIVVGALSLGTGSVPAQAQYYGYYSYAYPYAYYPYYYPYYPYGYAYSYWGAPVGLSFGFSFGGHHHR